MQVVCSYNQDIKTGNWAYWHHPAGKEFKTTIEQRGDFTNEYFLGIVRNIRPLSSVDTTDKEPEDPF